MRSGSTRERLIERLDFASLRDPVEKRVEIGLASVPSLLPDIL